MELDLDLHLKKTLKFSKPAEIFYSHLHNDVVSHSSEIRPQQLSSNAWQTYFVCTPIYLFVSALSTTLTVKLFKSSQNTNLYLIAAVKYGSKCCQVLESPSHY